MATVDKPATDQVTLEIDGQEVQATKGSMIIEVADRIGIDIPRFCYHSKLSIAANCRMCLVDVEKAPKPLPACATPIAEGMKVFTESRRAADAQRGVMEFLLINHPLDCPICDQGGECELQDLAMGYGRSVSRFTERKRVVKDKNLGPLVSTDMTRCIHCTRCVRFLEEIAGTAELGGIGRGEKTEISTFIERNINSELSGNIIDLCPVGALTNKPFRFSARPWEMRARPYIGTHDCLGSNLFYHVRSHRIMRTVPRDNEAINECWLSDRDRYSHYGLSSDDRLLSPRVKVDGQWQEVDWDRAIEAAAKSLVGGVDGQGGDSLGVLVSPRATSEEHFLIQKLARNLGCENVDHRLRLSDFSHPRAGRAHMDMASRDIAGADAIFLVGSNVRHDQPLLGHRVRTAWRKGQARIMDLNPVAYDCHFDLTQRLIVPPQTMVETLARVARAAADAAGKSLADDAFGRFIAEREPEPSARAVAETLLEAERGVILLGDGALNHPSAGWLRRLAEWMARTLDIALCVLPGPANSQGAWLSGAVPGPNGLDAGQMIEQPRLGYLLWDLEPEFDLANPAAAMRALNAADSVVAVTSFVGEDLARVADVLLPLAPVPETDGSYVNLDGQRQTLSAATRPPGQARPGWKILRRLGATLELDGFDFVAVDELGDELIDAPKPEPEIAGESAPVASEVETLWRVGDVPIYAGDPLLRRASALQATDHARAAEVRLNPATVERLGLAETDAVRVLQDDHSAELPLVIDSRIPPNAVWLPVAVCGTEHLGAAYGPVRLEGVA
ncbi:MAG: NADH-quinone oxidoreductase subunit G [Gammaproteobacteria bacterium]|jgi:NADH-quinone oxidoreductase subunit G|nr:NADH-quinone oxidoreductase subunit G [Gammaproteobacteria bacterium]